MTTVYFFFLLSCKASSRHPGFYPPGAVLIENTTYVRSTEVTIREYIEFVANNNNDSSLLPDKSVLIEMGLEDIFNEAIRGKDSKYFKFFKSMGRLDVDLNNRMDRVKKDDLFKRIHLPVTGISYNQAIKYCSWRQDLFNSWSRIHNVEVKLPSIEDYKKLIRNIDSSELDVNGNCNVTFNYLSSSCTIPNKIATQFFHNGLVRVDKLMKGKEKIFNLQGNVAEMTSEKGVSMGGSFAHFARQSYNDILIPYGATEKWLGFRYVTTSSNR